MYIYIYTYTYTLKPAAAFCHHWIKQNMDEIRHGMILKTGGYFQMKGLR